MTDWGPDMAKVVHFEIPTDDGERAKTFYATVFDWDLQTMEMPGGVDYTVATTTPVDPETYLPTEPGAINGGMTSRTETIAGPVITIDVPSIDDALAQVEANGGKTIGPRAVIEGMGAYAYFTDTEGNVMGLWETAHN